MKPLWISAPSPISQKYLCEIMAYTVWMYVELKLYAGAWSNKVIQKFGWDCLNTGYCLKTGITT